MKNETNKNVDALWIDKDATPIIAELSSEDLGTLFLAMMDYADNGIAPQLEEPLMSTWLKIQPMIQLISLQDEEDEWK